MSFLKFIHTNSYLGKYLSSAKHLDYNWIPVLTHSFTFWLYFISQVWQVYCSNTRGKDPDLRERGWPAKQGSGEEWQTDWGAEWGARHLQK